MPKEGRAGRAAGGLGSALAGAGTGAAVGSAAGPIGTAVGAGIGGLLSLATYLLMGNDAVQQQKIIEASQTLANLAQKKSLSAKEVKKRDNLIRKFPVLAQNYDAIAKSAKYLTPEMRRDIVNAKNNPDLIPKIQQDIKKIEAGARPSGLEALQGNAWEGYKPQELRFNRFSDEQIGAQNALRDFALENILKNAPDWQSIENKARLDFANKTLPSIAERFSGMNAQRSSGFTNQLAQAGTDLEERLAALRSSENRANNAQLSQLAALGLIPQFERQIFEGQPGIRSGLIGSAAELGINKARDASDLIIHKLLERLGGSGNMPPAQSGVLKSNYPQIQQPATQPVFAPKDSGAASLRGVLDLMSNPSQIASMGPLKAPSVAKTAAYNGLSALMS